MPPSLLLLLVAAVALLDGSAAFSTGLGIAPKPTKGCIALRAASEPQGCMGPGVSRRGFSLAAAAAAAALVAPRRSMAEEAAEPAAPEGAAAEDPAKLTVYGADASQLLLEGGVTVLGFGVVLAPTLLRVFGVIGSSEEEKDKYPSRMWTIDGATDGSKAKPDEAKDDSSSGKSL